MTKDASLLIVLGILVLLLALMVLGWYSRKRRQAHIGQPVTPPSNLSSNEIRFAGKYVATTLAGDRLNRVNVHGLGFRANCRIEAHPEGIVVARAGSPELWISRINLRAVSRASWTIDRVVEQNGLQVIEWTLDGTAVDSYFRMDDPETCEQALNGVVSNERQPK
ncbi:probable export or membrane protein [marine actinobacterium PHSC20C1]|nr:probable export or membrane protein [marine actinobacterium PHSC20C1]